MPNTHPNSGERLLRIVHEHWIKYVRLVLLYLVLIGVSLLLLLLASTTAHHYMWFSHISLIIALAFFLLVHHWFFLTILGESTAHLVITNHRVIRFRQRLFSQEDVLEVSFERMKTVEARKQGILENVLQYGSLWFEKGTVISLIPHPENVQQDIQKAMGK